MDMEVRTYEVRTYEGTLNRGKLAMLEGDSLTEVRTYKRDRYGNGYESKDV